MADDAIDTVASVLAQAFTLHDKSLRDAKAAFKKTIVDDRKTSFVVFPLDVMVAKQEVDVILPPLPPEEPEPVSPPPSPPADPVIPAFDLPQSHQVLPSLDDSVDLACKAKARAMALWELNYRTRPCENPTFIACGRCPYGGKCRFIHDASHRRLPPTDAQIDELADKYYVTMMSKKD